jgi:hypothetical protein
MLHLKSPGVGVVGSPGGGGGESSVHGACAQVVLELARIPAEDERVGAQLLQVICGFGVCWLVYRIVGHCL